MADLRFIMVPPSPSWCRWGVRLPPAAGHTPAPPGPGRGFSRGRVGLGTAGPGARVPREDPHHPTGRAIARGAGEGATFALTYVERFKEVCIL
eukprot:scaffold1085_cov407-Prasinococcus_capsulatus_cf.AAC.53